jgi:predicted CXXCH cytochrome family protein
MGRSTLSLTVFALIAAAALPAASAEDAVTFVTPWPGSIISGGPVIVAGTLPSAEGEAHFLLNGRPTRGFTRMGVTFSGSVVPPRGFNEIQVRLGEKRATLSFQYGVKVGGREPFTFHRPTIESKCASCHSREVQEKGLAEAAVCYGCHKARAILFPHVHGPVAAGRCLICHDPHGSNIQGLARHQPGEMCTGCHDQPVTESHTSSRTHICTICHDPHYGSDRAFLKGARAQ